MRIIDADSLKEKLCILGEHRIERLVEKEPTVDVLEQISDEVNKLKKVSDGNGVYVGINDVLDIIDKYRGDKE